MFNSGGIDAAAIGQDPLHLLLIKRDLIPVEDRLLGPEIPVGQTIQQLISFDGQGDDFGRILGGHFLILNSQGFNGHDRRLGAKAMAAGGPNIHLTGKPLPFNLLLKRSRHLGRSIGPATGHAHGDPRPPLLFPAQELVAIPFQFADG